LISVSARRIAQRSPTIVSENGHLQIVVAAIAPLIALGMAGSNPALQAIATEADERVRRALAVLEAAAPK
jgi:hypothetical protein